MSQIGRRDAAVLSESFSRAAAAMDRLAAWKESSSYTLRELLEHRRGINSLFAQSSLFAGHAKPSEVCVHSTCIHGVYMCPAKLGNGMQQFVSAMVVALVADRKLVWTWSEYGKGLPPCERFLHRQRWMQPLQLGAVRANSTRRMSLCAFTTATPNDTVEMRLACRGAQPPKCAVAELPSINTVRYSGQEAALLGLLAAARDGRTNQPGGGVESGLEASDAARAAALFALGPHYAYGRLFAAAFTFDHESVVEPTRTALLAAGLHVRSRAGYLEEEPASGSEEKREGTLLVGIHMRHRDPHLNGTEAADQCADTLSQVLARRSWPRCVVLLASDRRRSVPALEVRVASKMRGPAYTTITGSSLRLISFCRRR